MIEGFQNTLGPIARRRRFNAALAGAAPALLWSGLLAVLLILLGWATGAAPWAIAAILVVVAATATGATIGWLRPQGIVAAARAADRHYHFYDCLQTAVELSRAPSSSPLARLQIAGAVRMLPQVRPGEVIPLRIPRSLYAGMGLLLVLVALIAWRPSDSQTQSIAGDQSPGVSVDRQELARLRETLARPDEGASDKPSIASGRWSREEAVRRYFLDDAAVP